MSIPRRTVLLAAGVIAPVLIAPSRLLRAGAAIEVAMQGNLNGGYVWFDPIGLHIMPGQTVRWFNHDPGNAHTATAYHPTNYQRPRRIPETAQPWDSDYLMPGETFSFTFEKEGVYDYFCVPHEQAGMVGRIVVGSPKDTAWKNDADLPKAALNAFPSVHDILARGRIHAEMAQ
ncbi:hypothetical protein GCM10007972_26610 [Iodidimonas muriae]|uniref:Blue (type 1) copper domain-containing protein n=1 Tax=Iodidimonas muriae TaxID=261467 RepID=A0ABQ2LGJ4_9PROT|nr:plastocyanin/azurin family copper-binding protein [Iodidimonas muriae]GER08428.1 hypothetical protein JCM17843_27380 [Kordiimonadales bacterium JCM 17843]GGO16961.1 hypothetical protein GCM10007972_26610 [Iodidimonas muriae]